MKGDAPKVPKQAEAIRDGVITINFNSENFDALKTLRINRRRPENLATCVLGDYLVQQQ